MIVSTKQLWRLSLFSVLAFWLFCLGSFALPIGLEIVMSVAGLALLIALAASTALLIKLRMVRWRQLKIESQLTNPLWKQAIFWIATAGLLVLLYFVAAFHYIALIFRLI